MDKEKQIEEKTNVTKNELPNIKEMPFIILEDGSSVKRIRVGESGDWFEDMEFCTDCGAKNGVFHDDGCDCEICPVCGGQMLSCDCWTHYSTQSKT